jgi:type III pantothenate kinase
MYTQRGKTMLFCIDIGNTNVVLAVTEAGSILTHWRIRTDKNTTLDELGIWIRSLFTSVDIQPGAVKNIIITCVVPPLLNLFVEFSRRFFDVEPLVAGPDLDMGILNLCDQPKDVGSDRLVNAVGAYEKYRKALIVIDLGTATTFDYVSGSGAFMGGAIAPGIMISSEALFQKASKLPRIEILGRPKTAIAKDTAGSMNVGVVFGYAGLVDGIVNRMKKESDEEVTVVATGGLAPLICDVAETIDHVEPFLTLEGLMRISARNVRS